jgi:hypothetical protein
MDRIFVYKNVDKKLKRTRQKEGENAQKSTLSNHVGDRILKPLSTKM